MIAYKLNAWIEKRNQFFRGSDIYPTKHWRSSELVKFYNLKLVLQVSAVIRSINDEQPEVRGNLPARSESLNWVAQPPIQR